MEEAKSMSLEYQNQGGIDIQNILFLASHLEAKDKKGFKRVIVLNWDRTVELLNLLQKIKFFDLKNEYGDKQIATWHKLKLAIKNNKKEVTVYGDTLVIAPVISLIEELVEESVWQLYWDSSQNPDWNKWIIQEQSWFAGNKEPNVRTQKLKQMILAAYGWLKPEEREQAGNNFLALMEKNLVNFQKGLQCPEK